MIDDDNSALTTTVTRYVTPGQRYTKLLPGYVARVIGNPERFGDHVACGQGIARDALTITDGDLDMLLDYEWRSRTVASWLIAFARRDRHRARISELLLSRKADKAGESMCFALARLGTPLDAQVLVEFLHRNRSRPLLDERPWATGALSHLDARLGTHHADQFRSGADAPDEYDDRCRGAIDTLCSFAENCMRSVDRGE